MELQEILMQGATPEEPPMPTKQRQQQFKILARCCRGQFGKFEGAGVSRSRDCCATSPKLRIACKKGCASCSAPESHTLDCENFYIGDETKSSGEHWEMESIFECSWSSVKDPLEEHFERASGSDSSDHELSKLNSRETRLVPEVPEQKVISLADHLDWRSSKTNEKDAETERWRQLHPPGPFATQTTSGCRDIQRQNRVTLQLASLVQTAHPLFDELGREGYVHKRIHRKLHEKVVHFDDAQIKRLGEMCFRDQFAEAVKMDKVLGSARANNCRQDLLCLLHHLTTSTMTSRKSAAMRC
eukprot:g8194.t1